MRIKSLILTITCVVCFVSCKYPLPDNIDKEKDSLAFVDKADSIEKKHILAYKDYPFGISKNNLDLIGNRYLRAREVEVGEVIYWPIFKYQRMIGLKIQLRSKSGDEFLRELRIIYQFINSQYHADSTSKCKFSLFSS